MSFLVRAARMDDLRQLFDLAKQFSLLNLPADRKILSAKIEKSRASFAGDLPKHESEYLLVLVDTEEDLVIGSSLIMAKHGTEEVPHSYYKVIDRNHVSKDLGIGFIHKVLVFDWDTDGPTEIGGLLIDKMYRRRPEKLGKQISLSRFLYMGLFPERFEKRILCELTPPLTDEGRSEFWEALGRRFTGLPYQEADLLSQSHKEFIHSLFPKEDIYLCLLDAKARLVLGRVGDQTKAAQHLLESIGFRYIDEVDPFDGGPHFAVPFSEALPIKLGQKLKVHSEKGGQFTQQCLIGYMTAEEEEFHAVVASCDIQGQQVILPPKVSEGLNLEEDHEVFVAPFHYPRAKEQV